MASLWKKVFDLTYPVTAIFSGLYKHGISILSVNLKFLIQTHYLCTTVPTVQNECM